MGVFNICSLSHFVQYLGGKKHRLSAAIVGKSQFMQYAAELSPRAVMSSGRGSSSAGLTVTAIKDGGQWALEAGALVLADGAFLPFLTSMSSVRQCHRLADHLMLISCHPFQSHVHSPMHCRFQFG